MESRPAQILAWIAAVVLLAAILWMLAVVPTMTIDAIFRLLGTGLLALGFLSGAMLLFRAVMGYDSKETGKATLTLWGLFIFGVLGGIILFVWVNEWADASLATPQGNSDLFMGQKLPQEWAGTANQRGYKPYPMILYVEQSRRGFVEGKINWPTFGNSFTRVEGEFVVKFDDFVEQSKWRELQKQIRQAQEGKWLRLTETKLIAGSGEDVALHGQYYCYITSVGVLHGVYFSRGSTMNEGNFLLTRR